MLDPAFTQAVATPKLASVVARRIEDDIVELGWPIGAVVSSESALLERFGVSRAVLREALRIVELTAQRACGADLAVGSWWGGPTDAVAMSAGIWFSSLGVTVGEMLEARTPLLASVVVRAARRPDLDAIDRLEADMTRMVVEGRLDADAFLDLDVRVAELGQNPAVVLFIRTLGDVGRSRLRGTRARIDPPLRESDARRHVDGYRAVLEGVRSGRSEVALARLATLTAAVQRRMADRGPRPRRRPVLVDLPTGKLGERVAASIHDEVERSGWRVGTVVGSEAELMDRYGVSRSILREAIRLLEHHGAVQTKRGPGGGVVVAQPDSAPIVHSARMVLQYEGVPATDLWEARSVVEGSTARLAAERRSETTAAALLEAVAREASGGDREVRRHLVHHEIAAACGNRPLLLFTDVLSELTRANVRVAGTATTLSQETAEVHRMHRLIVEAVAAGDGTAAQRRMERHLSAAAKAVSGDR